jgi:uncharacterized protein (TIGR02265 family)
MAAARPRGSIKGAVLRSRLAFVRERDGAAGLDAVLERLTGEDRQALANVLAASWYPFEVNERLDQAIAAATGMGEAIFRLLGETSASDNLGAMHRAFVTRSDPQGLLQNAATIHPAYYDTGHRTYERLGDKRAVLRTFECLSFSRADCLTNMGWHEKAIEICGGIRPRVTDPRCRARGDDFCEYLCEWE